MKTSKYFFKGIRPCNSNLTILISLQKWKQRMIMEIASTSLSSITQLWIEWTTSPLRWFSGWTKVLEMPSTELALRITVWFLVLLQTRSKRLCRFFSTWQETKMRKSWLNMFAGVCRKDATWQKSPSIETYQRELSRVSRLRCLDVKPRVKARLLVFWFLDKVTMEEGLRGFTFKSITRRFLMERLLLCISTF